MKKIYTFRKLINDLHLWLGLASGIVLFVVCFTGTLLAFETDLVEYFDKEDYYSEKIGEKVAYQTIIDEIQKENLVVKDFIFFGEENKNIIFNVLTAQQAQSKKPVRAKSLVINPYTGEKVKTFGKARVFFQVVEKLHRFLLLDKKFGRPIVGISTIIFVFMCVSGLVLWFPKKLKKFKNKNAWKQGFTIKTSNWKRINYDIHNTLGFYFLIPLLAMGLSGLLWSFTWYYNGLEVVLGDKLGKSRFDTTVNISTGKTDVTESKAIDFKTLIKKTDSILNYPNNATRITLPLTVNQSLLVRKKSSKYLAYNASDKIQFNPKNNKIISIDYFKTRKIGSKIAELIRGIHVGNFVGMFSKIIYFLSCLIATSLPITGTIVWLNKMKKKKS